MTEPSIKTSESINTETQEKKCKECWTSIIKNIGNLLTWPFKSLWQLILKFNLFKMKPLPFAIVSISLFFLATSSYVELQHEQKLIHLTIHSRLFFLVMKEVGIALFILGMVTLTLELTDMAEYFLKKLKSIIIEDDYLKDLDQVKLEALNEKIEQRLYFKDQPHDRTSFFSVVQKEVSRLLDSCYYSNYDLCIECTILDNNYFKKRIHRKIEVVNPKHGKCCEKINFSSTLRRIKGQNIYNLEYFKINNEDKTEIVRKKITDSEENSGVDDYDVIYKGEYEVDINDKVIIDYVIETIVPITDIHYVHRIPKPCKSYSATFMLYSKDYELNGFGFGFMDTNNLTYNRHCRGLTISFTNWILTGDGVIFTLKKK